MKLRVVGWSVAGIVVVIAGAIAILVNTGRPAPGQPDGLQIVMQQLDANTRAAGDAIAAKDWPRVAQLADALDHHVEPPLGQKLRVMLWLRTSAPDFRGYDAQLRKAAVAMGNAAKAGDATAVATDYARLQSACAGCHTKYQAAYLGHFHGSK